MQKVSGMRNAENVTFGASTLDRAAHLRKSADNLAKDASAQAIVLWRGKPLLDAETSQVARLPLDHPILIGAVEQIFLGLSSDAPIFAYDISAWEPKPEQSADTASFVDQTQQTHPDAPMHHVFEETRAIMARLTRDDAELVASAKGIFGWHLSHQFCAKCGAASEVAEAGWQRNCPICKASHFPRTDPVVIMLITDGNNVLLGRSPAWPEKMYSLLAGFMEPGETVEAAVRREVFEESGISVGKVGYMTSQPWPFPSSLMIGCWGNATSTAITLDKNELEDALWISKEEIIESLCGNSDDILPARKGSIAQFLIENWVKDSIA
jgi:NAD+ diphosphatase